MDSNEEYLDQLLKSMMEEESSDGGQSPEEDLEDIPEDLSGVFSEDISGGFSAEPSGVNSEDISGYFLGELSGENPQGISDESPREETVDTTEGMPDDLQGSLFGNLTEDVSEDLQGSLSEEISTDTQGVPQEDSMAVQNAFSDEIQDRMERETEPEEEDADARNLDELLKMLSEETDQEDSEKSLPPETALEDSAASPDLDAAVNMSQSEIEQLLAANQAESEVPGPGRGAGEQDDLSSFMNGFGEDSNEDVQEISDLLNKADHDEPVDDALAALLQGLTEDESQNKVSSADDFSDDPGAEQPEKPGRRKKKERVKKEKKPRRDKKSRQTETDRSDDSAKPEKKPGFFSRLLNALTEEDGEEDDQVKSISDENDEILRQMEQEELEKARGGKKKKADKKKKGNKAAKSGKAEEEEGSTDKKKKEKKPKKEKKQKPVAVEEETSGKKLSVKKVLPILLTPLVITAAYVVVSYLYIGYANKQKAVDAYYAGDYLQCYELLFGQDLNESQAVMYHKSELILQMERAKKNYQMLIMEGKDLEALDYLVQFLNDHEQYRSKGQEWNSLDVVEETYTGMADLLTANYGLTERQAVEIATLEKDADYTLALMAVLEGTYAQEEKTQDQGDASSYENLLPEELEEQDTAFVDTIE